MSFFLSIRSYLNNNNKLWEISFVPVLYYSFGTVDLRFMNILSFIILNQIRIPGLNMFSLLEFIFANY